MSDVEISRDATWRESAKVDVNVDAMLSKKTGPDPSDLLHAVSASPENRCIPYEACGFFFVGIFRVWPF
jgi:hypothetical protein